MLVLSRRDSESVIIRPDLDLDPAMTVADLFRDGPLEVRVVAIEGQQVRLGIEAPKALNIVRDELLLDLGRKRA